MNEWDVRRRRNDRRRAPFFCDRTEATTRAAAGVRGGGPRRRSAPSASTKPSTAPASPSRFRQRRLRWRPAPAATHRTPNCTNWSRSPLSAALFPSNNQGIASNLSSVCFLVFFSQIKRHSLVRGFFGSLIPTSTRSFLIKFLLFLPMLL